MKILGYAAGGFTTVIALQLVIGGALMLSTGVIKSISKKRMKSRRQDLAIE